MEDEIETKYGLPQEVIFCKRCVMSNQKPNSTAEFKNTINRKIKALSFDDDGICDACRYAEHKEKINWEERKEELIRLLDKYRKDDGSYDCIVPGSGGKDSVYAAHILKYEYGMHPLTITWPPLMYTDYGYKNFLNWLEVGGFDNITFKPNGKTMKLLTRLSIENLFHPFQTFILGQKNLAPKIAINYNVPLIFYGENEAEYGNPMADNLNSSRDRSFFTMNNLDEVSLAGVPIRELMEKYDIPLTDLKLFLPPDYESIEKSNTMVQYLGYYLKWVPQEAYYYSVEHTGFKPRPFRTQGTYSKYNSIDDKIDDFHYYTMFIKFGLGRATYDASQEIRNKHLTREEGVALVKRFDGEFPDRYFNEIMEYINMSPERFLELCDKFRSPHLWTKESGEWELRRQVS
jgi:N-acetyl sugar amidotransferase